MIELLVVIVIIALLAAILFPVFSRARENARRSTCQSNQKQIGLAFLQYVGDYDERVPNRSVSYPAGKTGADLDITLLPYYKVKNIFYCPSQTQKIDGAGVETPWTVGHRSYGYNQVLASSGTASIIANLDTARMVLVSEIAGGIDRSSPFNETFINIRGYPDPRHFEGVNLLFVDGHVKWFEKSARGLTCSVDRYYPGTYWSPTATSP